MKYSVSIVFISSLFLFGTACSSSKKAGDKTAKKEDAKVSTVPAYKPLPSGLEYWIVKDVAGAKMPATGDFVELHLKSYVGDSLVIDSRSLNNNMPVQFQVADATYKGDLIEGLKLMTAGDSALFRIPVDSLVAAGVQVQPWMKEKPGSAMVYHITLLSVKTKDEVKKEQDAHAQKQVAIDEKILQDYFTKNNIKPLKTASGLYYVIKKEGTGPTAQKGQKVTVDYTGKFLDGESFDSNVDPKFQHVQPFSFTVGQGQVIKGWDEGFALLKKGGEATLYIPSYLAYGANAQGPIKENSILMFDIKVNDIE